MAYRSSHHLQSWCQFLLVHYYFTVCCSTVLFFHLSPHLIYNSPPSLLHFCLFTHVCTASKLWLRWPLFALQPWVNTYYNFKNVGGKVARVRRYLCTCPWITLNEQPIMACTSTIVQHKQLVTLQNCSGMQDSLWARCPQMEGHWKKKKAENVRVLKWTRQPCTVSWKKGTCCPGSPPPPLLFSPCNIILASYFCFIRCCLIISLFKNAFLIAWVINIVS
jgi:hypothetical protein